MKCEICNREFKTIQALNSHVGWHNKPNRKSNFISYNNSIKNGEKDKVNSNQFIKAKKLGLPTIIVSEETRKKIGKSSSERMIEHWKDPNNVKKQSDAMKIAVLNNPESYSSQNVSGRVKSYDCVDSFNNKVKLKGKWELKVATYLNDNNIKWTNKITPSPYFWNNDWHLYFPDFFLIDSNVYLEVKGYQRDRDIEKWNYFKDNLIIIKKKEISNLEKFLKNCLLNSKQ